MCRPFAGRLFHLDVVAEALCLLLDHDRIGAFGDHAAGEDTRRFTAADGARKRPPGGDFADDFQAHRHARHIGGAHGIAVHGGHVGGRLGAPRLQWKGKDAAIGVGERRFFGRQRRGVFEHAFERLSDRQ